MTFSTKRKIPANTPAYPSLLGLFANAMSTGRGGHTTFPTALGIVRLWGIRITLGYLFAFVFKAGSVGVRPAFSLSNLFGGIISILWIKYGKWAKAVVKKNPP